MRRHARSGPRSYNRYTIKVVSLQREIIANQLAAELVCNNYSRRRPTVDYSV